MGASCMIEERTLSVMARRSLMGAALLVLAMPIVSRPAIAQGVERSGKEVVQAVCAGCHATGANGAETPARADPNHKTVGGVEFFLGFMPAEALRSFPRDSVERTMHGGIPSAPGYYHVNVSLLDARTQAPINDANVEIRIEQPGLNSTSKTLEPMAVGAASYGNYVKLQKKTSYLITVRVQTPGSTRTVEAKFDHRVE